MIEQRITAALQDWARSAPRLDTFEPGELHPSPPRKVALVAAAAAVLAVLIPLAAVELLRGPSNAGPSGSPASPTAVNTEGAVVIKDSASERFDGWVYGWRVAPDETVRAELGDERNLHLDCDPQPAGAETITQLDFTLNYLPSFADAKRVRGPEKWVCGGEGLSVSYSLNYDSPLGDGDLRVERDVWGQRAVSLNAKTDRVEAGTIHGYPAILVHPADDAAGRGIGQIVVIENDTGPTYTILRMYADTGMPFDELLRIADSLYE